MMNTQERYERIVTIKEAIASGEFDDVLYERNCSIYRALQNLMNSTNTVNAADNIAALTVFSCMGYTMQFGCVDRYSLPATRCCCEEYKKVLTDFYKGFVDIMVFNTNGGNELLGRYHLVRVHKDGRVRELRTKRYEVWDTEHISCSVYIRPQGGKNRSFLHGSERLF